MAAQTSLASELFRAITAPKLTPIPAYLAEKDAMTVEDYLQSEYALNYTLDISNIHWGGEVNRDHVFDIFKNFSAEKDSVKTRLAMLEFVANNVSQYTRNCYCYLRMNNLTLDQWVQRMTHFDNGGDALSLYALSDLYGVHTTVLSNGRPWTTVHGNYPGNLDDVLQLSSVKLAYMGNDKYAVLWKKLSPSDPSLRERSYNYAPMLPLALPPSQAELDTAETLIGMQQGVQITDTSKNMPHPPEFETSNVSPNADAMDKVIDQYDSNPPGRPLLNDAMDQITGISDLDPLTNASLCVEMAKPVADNTELHVEMTTSTAIPPTTSPKTALCVETVKTKACSVRVRRLESILFPTKKPT